MVGKIVWADAYFFLGWKHHEKHLIIGTSITSNRETFIIDKQKVQSYDFRLE